MSEDNKTRPSIVVLGQKAHGIPPVKYQSEIETRLPDHLVTLAETPQEMKKKVVDAEVVTGISIDETLLAAAEQLQLFACGASGVDHLPLETLRDREITVTNASGVHGPNMSEQVLGYLLVHARRIREGWRRQGRREWRHYQASELNGSTVTVVGLGAIGTATARRLEPFDVNTIGVRYTPEKGGPTDEVVGFKTEEFFEALTRTDYLVIACPLTETTRSLIDSEEFRMLPSDSFLVNVGRGPIVNTDSLIAALQDNEIDGAALDVTDPEPLPEDHPLWNFDNVAITPHMAGHTDKYWARLADLLMTNLNYLKETGEYDGLENQVIP